MQDLVLFTTPQAADSFHHMQIDNIVQNVFGQQGRLMRENGKS